MGLVKRTYTDRETVITAENLNEIQDAILALEDGLFSVDNEKSGDIITITDAAKRGFRSLNIYGKTTQDGTPTPDAPVDLVSAGDSGSIGVTVAGKNLISNNWWQGMLAIEDGITLTSNNYWVTNEDYIAVDSGKAYIFSADTTNFSCVFWYDKNKNFISYEQPLINQAKKVLALPDHTKYARIAYNYSRTTEAITPAMMGVNHYVQLEFGTAATEYEPYKGQGVTIATPNGLPGIPVTSNGNYTDANGQQWVCDEIDFFRGVYVQRIKSEVLDGSAPFTLSSSGAFVLKRTDALLIDTNNQLIMVGVMCDAYQAKVWPAISTQGKDGAALAWGQGLAVRDNNFATVGDFNAHLATNPITMQYILATPIETPLTEEELGAYAALYTYKGHTTVYNDALAYMELEYVMDAKKYIDSLIGSAGGASAGILDATVE